jgi:hypothetical protein
MEIGSITETFYPYQTEAMTTNVVSIWSTNPEMKDAIVYCTNEFDEPLTLPVAKLYEFGVIRFHDQHGNSGIGTCQSDNQVAENHSN